MLALNQVRFKVCYKCCFY
ncbi:hypothetical protein ACIQ53_23360 [Bacillus tropicus]